LTVIDSLVSIETVNIGLTVIDSLIG